MESTVIEDEIDVSEEAENDDIPFIMVSVDGSPDSGNNTERRQNDASDNTERRQNDPVEEDKSLKMNKTRLSKHLSFTKNNNNTGSSLGDTTVIVETDAADTLTCMDYAKAMGPSILICLTDTDGAGLLAIATASVEFEYSFVLVQFLLLPMLFIAQELAVRIGIHTNKGLTQTLREDLFPKHPRLSMASGYVFASFITLICFGGLLSQFIAIRSLMEMFYSDDWITCLVLFLVLVATVFSGGYKCVEIVGLTFGACQLIFFVLVFMTTADWALVGTRLFDYTNVRGKTPRFLGLQAANIGNVIMPWMLAHQASALCTTDETDQKYTRKNRQKLARADTLLGTTLTQLVMVAVAICISSAVIKFNQSNTDSKLTELTEFKDIASLLQGYVGGETAAKVIITISIGGASLAAALVNTICAAWSVAEAVGTSRSLSRSFKSAPYFYFGIFLMLALAAFPVLLLDKDLVGKSSIIINKINAAAMPVVLFLLWWCSSTECMPPNARLRGWYKWTVGGLFVLISVASWSALITDFVD